MEFRTYAALELAALADKLADAARTQAETASANLAATYEATIEKLRADQTGIVSENERLTAENAALIWEKNELMEPGRASSGAVISRLADVFARIAECATVDDVLVATASGLTAGYGRVAVFRNGERLTQFAGEPAIDPESDAVLATPITVRGDPLAVLYSIDAIGPDGDGACLAAILCQHAALALDRLTIELKTIGELRAYAQMLLDEVAYVFEADMAAGISTPDRCARLHENLRCARQIYQQRVTLEGPAAASVLDDAVARMMADKANTQFGRELAALANIATGRSRPD
jgi:hypothetical protein